MNQTIAISEPKSDPKPQDSFEPMLKESIDRFLTQHRKGAADFSNFTSIFSRLLQNLPDPTVEVVWFYSALTCHSAKVSVQDSSKQVSVAKDLFQSLVSCSCLCNAVKKIAILAPVMYQLCHLTFDRKETKREIESLLEGIISYISICCGVESKEYDGLVALNSCFVDLVRIWMIDNIGESTEYGNDLQVFLPMAGDGVRRRIGSGCEVGYLAGVVMCEAFLLRLCLKFGLGISRLELGEALNGCAVQMIAGLRSYYFLDTILKMLLEPVLPCTLLLGSQDEVLLREVLYDALITVKYSFLSPERAFRLPGKHLKNLAMTWVFVADNAIRFVRESGDQTKVISYINAFSESCFPSYLLNWFTNQTGLVKEQGRPNISSPVALIKWLLTIDDQGARIFDCEISKIHARTVTFKSRVEYELPAVKPKVKNLSESLLFYSDNEEKGEDKIDSDLEMVDSTDNAFMAVPILIRSTSMDGARKRKEGRDFEGQMPVKFVKCNPHEISAGEKFLPLAGEDGLSSGSEVDNPVSDEDMEEMEQ